MIIEDQIASGNYQHVACNLCGSSDAVPYAFRLPKHTERYYSHVRRVKCCKCGFVYSDPQLTEKALHEKYQTAYDEEVKVVPEKVVLGKHKLLSELSQTVKNPAQVKILDIGCNIGSWLRIAQEFGFEVFGVEIASNCVNYARNVFGLKNVKNTNLFDARYPDEFFDLVVLWHTLEHVSDPLALLKEIKRILKPGGTFRIGVPSVYDPIYITNRIHCKLRGGLPPMSSDHLHTCEFTPSTLRMFLVKAGFYIQDLSSYYHSIESLTEGKNFGFRHRLNIFFWWYVAKILSRRQGHYGVIGPFGDGVLSKFGNGIVAHLS